LFHPHVHMQQDHTQKRTGHPDAAFALSAHPLVHLQQSIGNQAVLQMVKSNRSKSKLKAGSLPGYVSNSKRVNKYNNTGHSGRTKYRIGQYGFRRQERQRLIKRFGTKIDGTTHESEHTIGFGVTKLAAPHLKRKKGPRATKLEQKGWAYYENKKMHRKHIGTGNRNKEDGSGFTGETYRLSQFNALKKEDASTAVQLNQLGYAYSPFKHLLHTKAGWAATNSFVKMAENMDSVTYADGDQDVTFEVKPRGRAEMVLSRFALVKEKMPGPRVENVVREHFNLEKIPQEDIEKEEKKYGIKDDPSDLKTIYEMLED